MNVFIDCEWNSHGGDLISMALVTEDGREFYEVLECPKPHPWVAEHVIPHLNKEPISHDLFQLKLTEFLQKTNRIHLIADWVEDIRYFCEALILEPGFCINFGQTMTMEVLRIDSESKLPHNALEDARAIRNAVLMMKS